MRKQFKKDHPIFSSEEHFRHMQIEVHFDLYRSGHRAGSQEVWDSLDREMVEGILKDFDQEDQLKEQESLRRGYG